MARVLVTPHMLQRKATPAREILEQAGHDVVFIPEGVDTFVPEALRRLLISEGISAMLASTEPMGRELLAASGLKVIARQGVGYDSIDIPAATERGIVVTITPGTLEASVAEQTLAMLLGLTRGVIDRDQATRRGDWSRRSLPRLAGRVFGIVGLGRIGRCVVSRVQGLEMKVIGFDPAVSAEQAAAIGVERVESIDELLERSDVVSLHCPCTQATRNLIDRRALKRMKPTAILMNLGRGGLVDETALAEVLAEGHLLGAALDVFEREPLPLDSPLLSAPRLLLATHMGGIDDDSGVAASCLAARCIVDVLSGVRPEICMVNPGVLI